LHQGLSRSGIVDHFTTAKDLRMISDTQYIMYLVGFSEHMLKVIEIDENYAVSPQ